MSEFTWDPREGMATCSCGAQYQDRPGVVSPCPICGDKVCSDCGTTCPYDECTHKGRRVCQAHIIEQMPITPTHNDDVCVDCAKQILEDEAMTEQMFPAKGGKKVAA